MTMAAFNARGQKRFRREGSLGDEDVDKIPQMLRPDSREDIENSAPRHQVMKLCQNQRGPMKHPHMALSADRLDSLAVWDGQGHKSDLADAGFFCEEGLLCCYHCGGCIKAWTAECDPWKRHGEMFPNCGHLKAFRRQTWNNGVLSTSRLQRSLSTPNQG